MNVLNYAKNNYNDILKTSLYMFLIFYSATIFKPAPNIIKKLFKNNIFRLLVLFLIVYLSGLTNNLTLALLIAVAYLVTNNVLLEENVEEKFTEKFTEI